MIHEIHKRVRTPTTATWQGFGEATDEEEEEGVNGVIHKARAEDIYPSIGPESVRLVISDGPYGLSKATWDRVKDLRAWYAPHLDAWNRLVMPSSSLYFWNTAAGWAEVHPEIVAHGWTFRSLITWDKGMASLAGRIDTNAIRAWPDVTEVCGFYQRQPDIGAIIRSARMAAGINTHDLAALVVGTHSGAAWNWENGNSLPTPENWIQLWNALGDKRDEQSLIDWYTSLRVPFGLPTGVTNVWSLPQVGGAERLRGEDGKALHVAQKPLAFYERMILASTRPGDLVLESFGGTCRAAVFCEWLARREPDKARRYICIEPDGDGRDYIGAVMRQIRGEDTRRTREQISLF